MDIDCDFLSVHLAAMWRIALFLALAGAGVLANEAESNTPAAEGFGGGGTASAETHALVVLDARLQRLIEPELASYVRAAEARRGFRIMTMPVDGIDDWKPQRVRAAITEWLSSHPKLEGILFVGNVKLPSFFMPRTDLPETRLWPRYYEDPKLVAERRIAPGTGREQGSLLHPRWQVTCLS